MKESTRSTVSRLAAAAAISAFLLAVNFAVYRMTAREESEVKEARLVGFVRSSEGSHYIRRIGSFFWDVVQEGDPIYTHQQLRTGESGELRVELAAHKTFLELDPLTSLEVVDSLNTVFRVVEGTVEFISESHSPIEIQDKDQTQALPQRALAFRNDKNELKIQNLDESDENPLQVQLLSPVSGKPQHLNPEDPQPVILKWSAAPPEHALFFEYGDRRGNLNQTIALVEGEAEKPITLAAGRQFYRWGMRKGEQVVWQSRIEKLVVRTQFPPALLTPTSGQAVRVTIENKEKIRFKWNTDQRFSKYRVEIFEKERSIFSQEFDKDTFEFQPSQYGSYSWQVTGLGSEFNLRTRQQAFRVLPKEFERATLTWTTPNNQIFKSAPHAVRIPLQWTSLPPTAAKSFRVRYAFEGEGIEKNPPQIFKIPDGVLNLPRLGRGRVSVEALNSELESIGQSTELRFEVEAAQPLRAPSMASAEQEMLKASGRGAILLKWGAVPDASHYEIEVRGQDGKSISHRTSRSEFQLSKLMPGVYEYRVWAVDLSGQTGEKSGVRQFLVPEKGTLKVPKIRSLEVQ